MNAADKLDFAMWELELGWAAPEQLEPTQIDLPLPDREDDR